MAETSPHLRLLVSNANPQPLPDDHANEPSETATPVPDPARSMAMRRFLRDMLPPEADPAA